MKVYDNRTFHKHKLPFYLRRSTYIHVALFSLTLIGGKIIINQQEKLREANIELVKASVRVDMVAMPKYTLNELKNISSGVEEAKKEEPTPTKAEEVKAPEPVKEEPKVEAKAEEKDPTPSFEEASKAKRKDFLSKLKQIGSKKIESSGNQKDEKGLYGDKNSDLKQLVLSGNMLSKGSAITGETSAAEMSAFQAYIAKLPGIVKEHWSLPTYLADKKLNCRVRVWIAKNGNITRAEIYKSSGSTEYDQRAIEAIRASSFPSLNDTIAKRGQNGDILLGFPL